MQLDTSTYYNDASDTALARVGDTVCDRCHRPYDRVKSYQRFCSAICRRASWEDAHPGRYEQRKAMKKQNEEKNNVR
jgi:hypothetical protein